MGLVGLVRPRARPAMFGLHETTAEARSEVRAARLKATIAAARKPGPTTPGE